MHEKEKNMKKPSIFSRIMALFRPKTNTSKSKPLAGSEPYMFVTLKGKKFHYDPDCSGLRNSKTIRMKLSKAKKAGYTACDRCCYEYLHK